MPLTILTGGQSGVDEGALEGAGKYILLETAAAGMRARRPEVDWMAWLPKGYRRETPMPEFMRKEKGKRVGELLLSKEYEDRTQHNITLSDAVLLIEEPGRTTPGTKLTLKLAKGKRGCQLWRFQNVANRAVHRAESYAIGYWLRSMESWMGGPITLMVAGPRESKWGEGRSLASVIVGHICEAYERDIHVQPSR